MSLGKLPMIKSLVSNSHGKRRFKNELTSDMISPPLGDFRHTMHVGRGGDVFGDTSFLSNHGGDAETSKPNFLVRTFRNVRKSPARGRNSNSCKETSPPPPPISPIIKNAISLPHLIDGLNGSLEKITFKSTPASPSNMCNSYGLESGFCTLPRLSRMEKPQENSISAELELQRSDSMQSFKVDLGPSLMSEVMGLINCSENAANPKEGEEEFLRIYNFQEAMAADLKEPGSEKHCMPYMGQSTSSEDIVSAGAIPLLSTDLSSKTAWSMDIEGNHQDNTEFTLRPSREGSGSEDSRSVDSSLQAVYSIRDNQGVLRFQGFTEQTKEARAVTDPRENPEGEWDGEAILTGSETQTQNITLETLVVQRMATEQPIGVMEAEEFNRAAQVLACHYGGAARSVALKGSVRQREMPYGTGVETPTKSDLGSQEESLCSLDSSVQKCSPGHFSMSQHLSSGEEEHDGDVESKGLTASRVGGFSPIRSEAFAYADEEDEIKV